MAETKTIVNRKAKFEYQFIDRYEAGIVLTGPEVKSLRNGNANFTDAFCYFNRQGELMLKSFHISEYKNAHTNDLDPVRERKLLMKKSELKKLDSKVREKGFTLIPYKAYFNQRGIVKIEIALATGKKSYDKRATIKERDTQRELERMKIRL